MEGLSEMMTMMSMVMVDGIARGMRYAGWDLRHEIRKVLSDKKKKMKINGFGWKNARFNLK